MLSYEDIIDEIGKNVYIYPLNVDNVRGNSINLTASNIAFSVNGRNLISQVEGKEKIIIRSKEVALIETKEIIYVSPRIGGTYHSKVGKVSKGLSHIGTTLDPGYIGTSLISVCNNNDSSIELDVGDTLVSVILYYLKTPTKYRNTNVISDHINVFKDAGVSTIDIVNITNLLDKEWNKNSISLKNKMEKDDGEFNRFSVEKKELQEQNRNKNLKLYGVPLLYVIIVGIIIWYIDKTSINKSGDLKITEKYVIIVMTALFTKLFDKYIQWQKGE